MEYFSIGISILALLVALWSSRETIKYSRINFLHLLQQLMLQKAKDCNLLWENAFNVLTGVQFSNPSFKYVPTISEIIISIQLLDNSLVEYSQIDKRDFFLKQFWIQIDTSLREYFKDGVDLSGYHETTQQQIIDIIKTFNPLFKKY